MAIDLNAQTGLSSLPVIYYLEQLFSLKGLGINEGDALASGKLTPNDRERFEKYLNHHQSIFEEIHGIKLN
ncbi:MULTISPECIES: hypothetical protein [Shewanella]|uniref:hypothetical protein n=1 Tax=Shewanella TaxID=22 RepID=UPI001184A649|nr:MULTISPECIES: hypothetical protein [Shewanella]NDO76227.1 hypothetical protein [Shewanella sp. SE1]